MIRRSERRCAFKRRAASKNIRQLSSVRREARAQGIQVFGSGRVFPVDQDSIRLCHLMCQDATPYSDRFWLEHPTAAVEVAWDRI